MCVSKPTSNLHCNPTLEAMDASFGHVYSNIGISLRKNRPRTLAIYLKFVFWQDFSDLNKKTILNTEVFMIENGCFFKLKIYAWKKNDVWEFDSLLPGGGFKYFWCSRYFGEDSKMFTHFWESYFSKGVGFNHQLMVVQNLFFCWIYMKKNCPDFVMIN